MKAKNYFLYLSIIALSVFSITLSSCNEDDGTDDTKAAYTVNGYIISSEDETPIEGIRVILLRHPDAIWTEKFVGDTVYTSHDGFFGFQGALLDYSNKLYFYFEDVDNSDNGGLFLGGFHEEDLDDSDFIEVNKKYNKWIVNKEFGNIMLAKKPEITLPED